MFPVLILVLQIYCRVIKGIISCYMFCANISPHVSAYLSALKSLPMKFLHHAVQAAEFTTDVQ